MPGRIVAITVAYEDGSPENPTLIDLAAMRKYCRPERVDDLLDDLLMLCEAVQAEGRPPLTLLRRTR
jgi:hypothetical protein